MRPPPPVVEVMRRELQLDDKEVVLLGVTPEFARFGRKLLAVDVGAHMIGALWIGDDETRSAVLGDWVDLPVADSSVDVVVGDGCLSAVTTADARDKVLSEVARVLRPDGRAGIRLFAPPTRETEASIMADLAAKKYANCMELILRLSLAMPMVGPDYAYSLRDLMRRVDAHYPSRADMVAAAGWIPETVNYFAVLDLQDSYCSWPDLTLATQEASRHFNTVKVVESGRYSGAEYCPILVLENPRR